jgi:hypothetical protein
MNHIATGRALSPRGRTTLSSSWEITTLMEMAMKSMETAVEATALSGPRDLSYTEMLCVLVTLATSDTGVTNPRPKHHRQAGRN